MYVLMACSIPRESRHCGSTTACLAPAALHLKRVDVIAVIIEGLLDAVKITSRLESNWPPDAPIKHLNVYIHIYCVVYPLLNNEHCRSKSKQSKKHDNKSSSNRELRAAAGGRRTR